jgi:IS30 family transposase
VTADRLDRRAILTLVPNRESNEARKALLQKLYKLEPEERRTVTSDNGPEHADFPELEKVFSGLQTFYCGPYRSWERGTVEATNGIIRRWFPKGTNFDNVTPEQVQEVEDWLITDLCLCLTEGPQMKCVQRG